MRPAPVRIAAIAAASSGVLIDGPVEASAPWLPEPGLLPPPPGEDVGVQGD
jgi:hypothetical protein